MNVQPAMSGDFSNVKNKLIYSGLQWVYEMIKEIGATHALTLSFSGPFNDMNRDERERERCTKILKYGMNNINKKIYGSHNRGVIPRFITIERGVYNKTYRLHARAVTAEIHRCRIFKFTDSTAHLVAFLGL